MFNFPNPAKIGIPYFYPLVCITAMVLLALLVIYKLPYFLFGWLK